MTRHPSYSHLMNKCSPEQVWGPLFFQDHAIGADFFAPDPGAGSLSAACPNASALAETIVDPTMFFTDPPGIVGLASYCNHTVPEWRHDKCWTVPTFQNKSLFLVAHFVR